MVSALIIYGLLSDSLLSVLVGIFGARRRIGFGWTFIISLVFTPFVGLIVALISDPLPNGERRWGCIATILALVVILALVGIIFAALGCIGLAFV